MQTRITAIFTGVLVGMAPACAGQGDDEAGASGEEFSDTDAESGGDGDGDGDGDATAALGAAYCAKLFGCCDGVELADQLKFYEPTPQTEQECATMMAGLIAYEAQSIRDQQDLGRLVLHEELMGECADAVLAADCDEWNHRGDPFRSLVDDPACAGMVEPLSEEGGGCNHDRACITGDCGLVDQVCVATPGPGDACEFAADCIDGYFCGPHGDAAPTCIPTLEPGSACQTPYDCSSSECEALTCVGVCDGA